MTKIEVEELIEQREAVFHEIFSEFAFLTLRQYQPDVLTALIEGIRRRHEEGEKGGGIELSDPYRLMRALIAGATRYIGSGQAELFYTEGASVLMERLNVCLACRNGEHERCYIDAKRGSHCSCPCSKAMEEVRAVGESIGRIRKVWKRVMYGNSEVQ